MKYVKVIQDTNGKVISEETVIIKRKRNEKYENLHFMEKLSINVFFTIGAILLIPLFLVFGVLGGIVLGFGLLVVLAVLAKVCGIIGKAICQASSKPAKQIAEKVINTTKPKENKVITSLFSSIIK